MLGLQSTKTQVQRRAVRSLQLHPQSHHTSLNICRPKCAQCGINNVACQWPQPRKRGPPKHYIMTMEKRLMETESVLCALMTQVSDDQLFSAFSQPSNSTALDLVKTPQFGPVYWGNYPLKSAQDVKRWFKARASITADVAQSQRPRSIGVDLQESEGTHSGTDESHENDFDETDDTVGMIAIEAGQAERKGRETTSRSSDGNVVQEDAASAAAHLGLARQSLTVASNINASSAAPRISPEPEDHESYESAFLW